MKKIQDIASKIKHCSIKDHQAIEFFSLLKKQQKQYSKFEFLGNGGFAFCIQAFNSNTNQAVALKIIECEKDRENGMELVQQEYRLLKNLAACKYIVQVKDSFFLTKEFDFGDDEDEEQEEQKDMGSSQQNVSKLINVFFVVEMELCDFNLESFIKLCKQEKRVLDQKFKETLAIQMLDGLAFLHSRSILHRDIKPSNFLLMMDEKKNPTIKICDLAFATELRTSQSRFQGTMKGTKEYMAPETFNKISKKESDLFSLGIVLLELDNLLTFEFTDMIDKSEYHKGKIFPSFNINRNTDIYKVAQTFLSPELSNRKSAMFFLDQLFHKDKAYQNIELTSMIIENQLQFKSQQISQIQKSIILQKSSQYQNVTFQTQQQQEQVNQILQEFQKIQEKPFSELELQIILKNLFNIGNFEKHFEIIDFGAVGLILGAFNKSQNRCCVLKVQQVKSKSAIAKEVGIIRACQMPLVVKFYGYFYLSINTKEDFVVYELEKCQCNLEQYLSEQFVKGEFSDELKERLAHQVLDSVNYLHQLNIIHRDIKLKNFLVQEVNGQPVVKLNDFDSTEQLSYYYYHCGKVYYDQIGLCGTLGFQAPEFLKVRKTNKLTDVFSLGICLALIDNFIKLQPQFFFNSLSIAIPFDKPFYDNLINRQSFIYKNAIQKAIVFNAQNRMSLDQILASIKKPYYSQINKELNSQSPFTYIIQLYKRENNIGSEGAKALGQEIAKCPTLSTLTLDLQYNKIGSEGAKALGQEIAKCPTLSTLTLDLYSNNIGSEGAKALGQEIAKCPTLSTLTLDLYSNNIGSEGAKALGQEIAKCPTLSTLTLYLSSNNIGSEGAKALGQEIAKCPTLSTLTLYLSSNNIGSEGAKALGQEIAKCPTLSTLTLDLYSNNIGSEGAKALGQEIAKCPTLSTLTLDLQYNKIGSEGAKALGQEIAKCPTLSTLTLDLQYNNIGSEGAKALGQKMAKCPTLSTLTLDLYSNSIGSEGAKALGQEIAKCPTLSTLTLYLSSNNIGSEGAKALGQEIAKCPTLSTLTLYLRYNKIGSEGAKALGQEIAKCPTLSTLTLDLYSNNTGSEGAKALGQEIAKCPTLSTLTLDLQENNIGSEGAKALGQEIAKCPTLSTLTLDLYSNNIGSEGAKALGQEIAKCPTLSTLTLYLRENNIGSEGAKALGQEIAKCPTLSTLTLYLRENNIGSEGAKALGQEIAKCPTLSTLTLYLSSNNIGSEGAKALGQEIAKCPTLSTLTLDLLQTNIYTIYELEIEFKSRNELIN
ncbi:hypothetical protein ABPG74_000353 [Tetrahymena malaccensis]